jgi:signal peptidase I
MLKKNVFKTYVAPFLVVFTILAIKASVLDFHPVPSSSMSPGIKAGDLVIDSRISFGLRVPLTNIYLSRWASPKKGDVVFFESPIPGFQLDTWIKRVVAVGGDTVEFKEKSLYVNGKEVYCDQTLGLGEYFCLESLGGVQYTSKWGIPVSQAMDTVSLVTVPKDNVLLIGDNRSNSNDGRIWGFKHVDMVYGKHVGTLPGWAKYHAVLFFIILALVIIVAIRKKYKDAV